MRSLDETVVTVAPDGLGRRSVVDPVPDLPVTGIWRLTHDGLVRVDADGPATVLVPSESVLMTAVDLPLSSRAKRLEALPFALEDRIADPVESVHMALGDEVQSKSYLVGVVRHSIMADWLARVEQAGMARAALVPDALALPRPDAEHWAVALENGRALVRTPDGAGFAVPETLLINAWERAGRPHILSYGDPLPETLVDHGSSAKVASIADQLARPALNLRQGPYAVRGAKGGFWRQLGWIVAIAVVAHALIALVDVFALRSIMYRKANETMALVHQMAPNAKIDGDIAAGVTDLLPTPQGDPRFANNLSRLSSALMPLRQTLNVRSIRYDGRALIMDIDTLDPSVADQVRSAVTASGVKATIARSPAGGLVIKASGA